MYNAIHGMTPIVFFILPMLGKHPETYPRFRDCFLADESHPEFDGKIHVYTRTGGANRESYVEEIEVMRGMPTFISDFDDSFDNTYASFVFDIPKEWQKDFTAFTSGNIKELSDEYWEMVKRILPKLTDKFNQMQNR